MVPTPHWKDAVEVAKEREEKAQCNCLPMAKRCTNAIGELWRKNIYIYIFQVLCAIMERNGVWLSTHRDWLPAPSLLTRPGALQVGGARERYLARKNKQPTKR